jgi:hypothetical protein
VEHGVELEQLVALEAAVLVVKMFLVVSVQQTEQMVLVEAVVELVAIVTAEEPGKLEATEEMVLLFFEC